MKQLTLLCMLAAFLVCAGGCGTEKGCNDAVQGSRIVCGTSEYDQLNPLEDEYSGEALRLFDGVMRRDATGATVPGLAASYEYDPETYTYVFRLRDGVFWHDGKPLRAADVKFTIEAIQNPLTGSFNAQNFEDVREITELDDKTVRIRLSAPNTAFLDYMVQSILPAHLLAGRDLKTTGFFRSPVGTGPFRIDHWEAGKEIVLVKNEDYYRGAPKVDSFVFKIIEDDVTEAQALADGQIDMAHLAPTNAAQFMGNPAYRCYDMKTTDYRAILFNFAHPYWQRNRDLIPAISYAIDRQALIDKALLGYGTPAYGPLQRSIYNNPNVQRYDYDPAKAQQLLEAAGCVRGADGYYMRGGEEVGFRLTTQNDNFARSELVHVAAEQLCAAGIHCTVETPAQIDWAGQMAYLVGWGSPLDPDMHTYKVFTTNGKVNVGRYSNARVDEYLMAARRTSDPDERMRLYGLFQEELAKDPPYVFLCYIDAVYVANARIHGIAENNLLGHRAIGFFGNVNEWTVE